MWVIHRGEGCGTTDVAVGAITTELKQPRSVPLSIRRDRGYEPYEQRQCYLRQYLARQNHFRRVVSFQLIQTVLWCSKDGGMERCRISVMREDE
ncbi:hypothetical protein WG66_007616 [Moniliophthora roreri]|nr:hypothetical protein WG66_007616 [Moniliophthora roreri]